MVMKMDRKSFLKGAAAASVVAGMSALEVARAAEAAPANRVCEILGIEKPVFSAPMWALTNAEMVAAVSNAGGCGILNCSGISLEVTYPTAEDILTLASEELYKIRELTDKPFGVMMPILEVPGLKDVILDVMPGCMLPGASSRDDVFDYQDAGIKIIGSAYDSDPEVLRQLSNDCDIIYLKCYSCGGTIPYSRANSLALLQKFANQGIEAPIVVGGGVVNAAGAAAVTAAGAEGVWVGTRFLATDECPAHPDTKQTLLDLHAADMVEIDFGSHYNHCNASPKALEFIERLKNGEDPESLSAGDVYLFGMRLGDLDNWYISVDDSVDCITEITPCSVVVDELGDAVLATQAMMA